MSELGDEGGPSGSPSGSRINGRSGLGRGYGGGKGKKRLSDVDARGEEEGLLGQLGKGDEEDDEGYDPIVSSSTLWAGALSLTRANISGQAAAA